MPNCEKKLINLYSSTNFVNPSDSKCFGKWDVDAKLKSLINFTGEFKSANQPNIYFKAKVKLNTNIDASGTIIKSNVVINDILFKNQFNVSASSLTADYKYLYDISCGSADNNSSESSGSVCSSELSLSEIYANGVEKQIMDNVKAFIEGQSFKITRVSGKGYYTLDTTQYDSGNTFPNVKMSIKSKLVEESSETSITSSVSPVPNNVIKKLVIGFVALLVVMCFIKFLKNKNCGEYSQLYDGINEKIQKNFSKISQTIKSLFSHNAEQYKHETIPTNE